MRYESALQVIRFLKRSYGAPASISCIARNISLSYQPTHKHVRTLEHHDVIETVKAGREVLCQLRASTATQVWLSLLALEERERLLGSDGALGALAKALEPTVSHGTMAGLEAVAIREVPEGMAPEVALLVHGSGGGDLARRFRARCRATCPDTPVRSFTGEELAERLSESEEQCRWVMSSTPLYGEQRFWAALLPDEASPEASLLTVCATPARPRGE